MRTAVLVIGFCLFAGCSLWLSQQRSIALEVANELLGEVWYRIELDGQHVGYMHHRGSRSAKGEWLYRTDTHFLLRGGQPHSLHKQLTFAHHPPYALNSARYESRQGQRHDTVRVELNRNVYTATVTQGHHNSKVLLDWQFTLEDFVAFETWLAQHSPDINFETRVQSPDFERLTITSQTYRVTEYNQQGYVIETRAPHSNTRTQLDARYRPISLRMAGLFDVIRSNKNDAVSVERLAEHPGYVFALNTRLTNHTEIAQLRLAVHSESPTHLPAVLSLNANPKLDNTSPQPYRSASLDYPSQHPIIRTLLNHALGEIRDDTLKTLEQLVRFTHRSLRYAPDQAAGSVLAAIEQGRGECTDYADLLTTLARAAGFPARSIYGLAYRDASPPSLQFHAWNEVFVNGQWQVVDPTWDQMRVDATHIPLSHEAVANLMLASHTGPVEFEVLEYHYFSEDFSER